MSEKEIKKVLYAINYTLGCTKKEMNPDEAEKLLYDAKFLLESKGK